MEIVEIKQLDDGIQKRPYADHNFAKDLVLFKIIKEFSDPLIKGFTDMLDEYRKLIKMIPEMDAQLRAVSSELGKFLGDTESHELTGIAKSVSQATEEEILTLSGYANSILYNQIYIKKDVAAIRGILEKKMIGND